MYIGLTFFYQIIWIQISRETPGGQDVSWFTAWCDWVTCTLCCIFSCHCHLQQSSHQHTWFSVWLVQHILVFQASMEPENLPEHDAELPCFWTYAATTLTSWHLMVTFCTLHVAQRLHFFEPKAIDGQTVILFGLLNGTSIGLLNLSLGFNSIGFYQVIPLFFRTFVQYFFLQSFFLKFSMSHRWQSWP